MVPITSDTKLDHATENLKLDISRIDKIYNHETTEFLERLNSITKLLRVPQLYPEEFQRLSHLLRQGLLPLYRTSLALTLQFSITVFIIIHEERILPTTNINDDTMRNTWEGIQNSLLSGILDFLEEHPTYDNRTSIAGAIYTPLRAVYGTQSISPYIQQGSTILRTVYELLAETVTAHQANQHKLRKPDYFGGKQIGAIITQTKGYLALDAILMLFAKLLPSTKNKGGREKRTRFINEVFNSSMTICSSEIVHILETISSTDWEHTSAKIVNALSKIDVMFPQPFEIGNFEIYGSGVYNVDRLYIDNTGFVANVDQAGELETFEALYSGIKSIRLSAPSASKTRVTLLFLNSPIVGQASVPPSTGGEISVLFDIQNKDVALFVKSLNARGLEGIVAKVEKKLSKPMAHLDLNFEKENALTSTQDKVENIQRLWDGILPTSPLLVPGDGGTRFWVSSPEQIASTQSLIHPKGEIYKPISTRSRATKPIPISDDENEKNPLTTSSSITKSDLPLCEKESQRSKPQGTNWPASISSVGRKRLFSESGDETSQLQSKRSRQNQEKTKTKISAKYPLPPPRKKYGRKGRTSSPLLASETDRDEPPVSLTDQPGRIGPASTSSRCSQEKTPLPQAVHTDGEKPLRSSARVAKIKGGLKTTKKSDSIPIDNITSTSEKIDPKTPRMAHPDQHRLHDKQVIKPQSELHPIKHSPKSHPALKLTGKVAQKSLGNEGSAGLQHTLAEQSSHKKSRTTPRSERDSVILESPDHSSSLALTDNQLPNNLLNRNNTRTWSSVEEPDIALDSESPSGDAHPSIQEEYFESIVTGSTFHEIPVPDNNIVMIDLTQDSPKLNSPIISKADNHKNKSAKTNIHKRHTSPRRSRPTKLPTSSPPALLATRSIPKPLHVAFAPDHTYHEHVSSSRAKVQISPLQKNTRKRASYRFSPLNDTDRVRKSSVNNTSKIIDLIGEITRVIVNNTSKRFDSVRNELHAGQMSILLETADDLEKMRTECIDHFNTLVDTETEYARHRRRIVDSFEDFIRASQDISENLSTIIQEHSRNSLSRKFLDKLFPSSLPSVLLNPELVV